MVLRISAFVALLLSILFMPFWVSIILTLAGMIYFSYFLEGVALLFLSDLLYGIPEARFSSMIFISLTVAIVLLVLIELVKKRIKFYPTKR